MMIRNNYNNIVVVECDDALSLLTKKRERKRKNGQNCCRVSSLLTIILSFMLGFFIPINNVLLSVMTVMINKTQVVDTIEVSYPNFTTSYPSLHNIRHRLNTTKLYYYTSYQPKYIRPERCQYMNNEKDCREEDERALKRREGQKTRKQQQQQQQQQQQRNLQSSDYQSTPNEGTLRVLVLLIRFADHGNRELPSREYFDELFNGVGGGTEVNEVGSIKEYLWFASMGKYDITFDVEDWYTVSQTEQYYSQGKAGKLDIPGFVEIFKEKLNALDNEMFDFNPYDKEGWGDLNHMAVIHSGHDANYGDPPDGCTENTYMNRLWSMGIRTIGAWTSMDGFSLNSFYLAGAFDEGLCHSRPSYMGIHTHEYLHGLGCIDLYDQDPDDPDIPIGGTASYDIFSNYFGVNRNKSYPSHLSPYSRILAGWLEPIEITKDGTYAIQASEFSSQVYKIPLNSDKSEYLLIENRQPVKWDGDWKGSGIVIYAIDEKKGEQTERGYPGHPNWPGQHYRVAVLQADGNYDIEKGNNVVDETDFWTKGMTLGPSDAKAGTTTWPNTDSYSTGSLVRTGISITVTSDSKFIMTFDVQGLTSIRSLNRPRTIDRDPDTTGYTLKWLLSMFVGMVAMFGVLLLML